MGFIEGLNTLLEFGNTLKQGYTVGQLIALDRASAMQALEYIVQNCTPQQLDEFEWVFLNAAMGMVIPVQRIRSMELYAYLKYLETRHYGQWRGFCASTQAQALC